MDIAERLRTTIAPCHGAIEELPVAQAMATGALSRSSYLALLGQLFHVHGDLEKALGACRPAVALYRPEMARRDVIARDLAVLGGKIPLPAPATRKLCEQFGSWQEAGDRLLGALYVFEGSRMGSMFLSRSLAQALQVRPAPGQGLDYHIDGIADRPRAWKQFKAALNQLPLTPAASEEVVTGAALSMEGLYEVYAAVPPVEPLPVAPAPVPVYEAVS